MPITTIVLPTAIADGEGVMEGTIRVPVYGQHLRQRRKAKRAIKAVGHRSERRAANQILAAVTRNAL